MLHPNQLQVNEARVAFKLNDAPPHTERAGDFDFVALMDAAGCFILSAAPVPAKRAELTKREFRRLLKQGKAHNCQLPKTLFVAAGRPAKFLIAEAQWQGISPHKGDSVYLPRLEVTK